MSDYFLQVSQLMNTIEKEERQKRQEIARNIAQKIQQGGVIHLFGCGHSALLAQEIFYRAGGLVPAKPILIEPLMLHTGAQSSAKLEKQVNYIPEHHRHAFQFEPHDVFIVISTSARNPAPIDAALLGKEQDVYTVSLQSLQYVGLQSNHPSGKRLEQIVDDVMDSHVPVGDAVIERGTNLFGPVSTVIGAYVLQSLFVEVLQLLPEPLPIFSSNNVTLENENDRWIHAYNHRIDF